MTEAIKKNAVNFGIILAVYYVVRTALMYAIDLKLFTNGWINLFDLVVSLTLSILAIAKAKKALGGYIAFKDAFTVYLITTLISFAIYTVFTILLFNVIDTEAKEVVHQYNIEKTVENLRNWGVDSSTIKKTAEGMKGNNSLSIGNQLIGFPIGIAISCIVGLILAAIMKKNKPEFQ